MNTEAEVPVLGRDADGKPVITVGGTKVATLAELVAAVPDLTRPERLDELCDDINHLQHGSDYRVIHDADAYRAWYEQRLQSEAPDQPFQSGVVRLRDFGHCETAEIQAPHQEGASLIFYVEDDYLGIPYRVTAPLPEQPDAEITYEPLPMSPFPE